MITLSMNGRVIIASSPSPLLSTITIAGQSTQVLAGDSAAVLAEVAARFNAAVEPIATLYGWRSVATNIAAGGIPTSNHMSGTAIDINGAAHPRYRRGTFTAAQVSAIRKIVADLPGVKWGGDYPSDVDEMHFELTGTAAVIATTAATIRTQQEDDMTPDQVAALNEVRGNVQNVLNGVKALMDAIGSTTAGQVHDVRAGVDIANAKLDNIANGVVWLTGHTGGDGSTTDLTPILAAIKALPEQTVAAIKAAL